MEEKILNGLEDKDMLSEDMQKKLARVFERYQQLSDEEKEEFQKGAFDVLRRSRSKLFNDTILPAWLAPYQSFILFTVAVSLVIFLFVIVTRKLYQRAKEREYGKREKKKLKDQKAMKKKK